MYFKIFIKIYFYNIFLIYSKGICLPGSSECVENGMKMCDINGQWVLLDCPNGTKCGIEQGKISCMLSNNIINNIKDDEQIEDINNKNDNIQNDNTDDNIHENIDDNTDNINNNDKNIKDNIKDNTNKNIQSPQKSIPKKKVNKKSNKSNKLNKPNKSIKTVTVLRNKKEISPRTVTVYKSKEEFNKPDNTLNNNLDKNLNNNLNNDKSNDNKNVLPPAINANEDLLKSIKELLSKNQIQTIITTVTEKTAPKEIKLEYTSPQQIQPSISNFQSSGTANEFKPSPGGGSISPTSSSTTPNSGGALGSQPSSSGLASIPSTGASTPGAGSSTPSSSPSTPGTSVPTSAGSTSTPASPSSSTPSSSTPSSSAPSSSTPESSTPSSSPSSSSPSSSSPSSSTPAPSTSPTPASAPSDGNAGSKPESKSSEKSSVTETPSTDKKPATDNKPADANKSSTDANKPSSDSNQPPTDSNKSTESSSGGGSMITEEALSKVMKSQGFAPKPEFLKAAVKQTNEKIKDKNMAAQLLAQLGHESGGFQYIEEIACAGNKCPGQYGSDKGAPGKQYYGRGFIQLSWPENYEAASKDILKNKKLWEDPDSVSKDPNLGMQVSIWFWEKNVMGKQGVGPDHFGYTTKAINGALECTGQNVDKSKKRYAIYQALAKEMKLDKIADEKGCYS